ncbi:mast cell protease 1A-like [Aricia agestis]|uniref:mast cell protease 1A-like n=1 Tax=Aricia agestis TaxID=91739 RepID=UPI001C209F48|nr:mast cell protease 1A-like [Aricia agestis]
MAKINYVRGSRIIGGHEAKPHSHPYIVSLQLRFLWASAHLCGGSILNENWILTAGHCISESWLIRLLNIDAVAGAHDVEQFGPLAQVARIDQRIPHPLYAGGVGPHDIAVLSTKTKFTFSKYVQPVNLPTSNYRMDDKPLMTAGWGALRSTVLIPDLPRRLQELQVKYIPYKECFKAIDDVKEPFETNPLEQDAHVCTGPLGGGMAACSGDSGGPLVQVVPRYRLIPYDDIEEEYGRAENVVSSGEDYTTVEDTDLSANMTEEIPVILGVVSFGFSPCGYKGAPTVYTKVSNYLDFIEAFVK